jgi:ATP-dependent Lon protease
MDTGCQYIYKDGLKKGTRCLYKKKATLYCKMHENKMSKIIKKTEETLTFKDPPIKDRILTLDTSLENKTVMMKHYNNLKRLDPHTTEYYKNYVYLESCVNVPWGKLSSTFIDTERTHSLTQRQVLMNVSKTLDKGIYGMDTVKNELLNFTSRMMTNPNSNRNILGLYGLAGSGKTKMVHTIAKALGTPLKTVSLGGVKDSSFFLGHGYIYVESGPGVIIQSVMETKCMNPIIYFDELDKVSETQGGKDIYSFLTYLTDPSQNDKFSEHYFQGLKFDLSKVFFIFTFNDITKIDKVLLDRINLIKVPEQSTEEKCKILFDYCVPEILSNIGLKDLSLVSYNDIKDLVNTHGRETSSSESTGIRYLYLILESALMEYNKNNIMKTNDSFDLKSELSKVSMKPIENFNSMYI